MAFLTEARARAAAGTMTANALRQELRAFSNLPRATRFDVFLSHSYIDAPIIYGVKELLEQAGVSVYVDWIEDSQVHRDRVTVESAELLRTRMQHSKSLYFVASEASSKSIWMPWELGYFDGIRPGHVAILPIVKRESDDFRGQEYLGLYPPLEDIGPLSTGRRRLAFRTATREVSVREFLSTGVTVVS